jgi:hypothetical protein
LRFCFWQEFSRLCNGRANAPEHGNDGVAFLAGLEKMSHNFSISQHKAEGFMITRILKWTAIAVLIGGLFWGTLGLYGTLLQFVVSAAAIVVLVQAAGAQRYVWMGLFVLAACLFNPVVPIQLSHQGFMAASIFTVLLFFFSIELLQPKAKLSIASITGRRPGSESL